MIQAYSPFRTSLISRDDLHRLNVLRPWIAMCHTIWRWALIVVAWVVVAKWPSIYTAVGAFFVVGINFYGLYIILHDGIHRRIFPSVWLNDLWNDVTMMAPIGAITHINRHNHMMHHRVTCLPDDPDRFKYVHEGKEPVMPFMSFLTGLTHLVPIVRNVFFERPAVASIEATAVSRERYTARDVAILFVWQATLIGGLTYFISWWAYPLLWLAPAYALAYRADVVRVFCEHSMMTSDAAADESMRLVTYESNWFEKMFFAPHNMNFHMAHHLWPSIPYYNLPEADRLIRDSEYVCRGDSRLIWRKSYFEYIWSYAKWRVSTYKVHQVSALGQSDA